MSPNLVDVRARFHIMRRPARSAATLHGIATPEGSLLRSVAYSKNEARPEMAGLNTRCIYADDG